MTHLQAPAKKADNDWDACVYAEYENTGPF